MNVFFSIRIISEPRLQNPYLLYSNTNSHSSPYNFSTNEYQQRKIPGSFTHSCKFLIIAFSKIILLIFSGDIVDQDPSKDELSVHDTCSNCK